MEHVADDFSYTAFWRPQFGGDDNGTPTYVIINGLADSASHQQWEIVDLEEGWDIPTPANSVNALRADIDSVEAAPQPPVLGPAQIVDGKCQFTVTSQAGSSVCIESTTDFVTWTPVVTLPNPTGTLTFHDENAATGTLRAYRAQLK